VSFLARFPSLIQSRTGSLVALALLFTLLNVPKPLLIDDSAYYYYAKQIAKDPLRPYSFEMFWYTYPQPANEVLAPPVLPYWWSIAYRLFGERPYAWKLWLFPFSLLFVFSLDALFRRFCRGMETPLVWMTVLSPTFLPSLNLMLDVPALALALGSITLFLRACALNSFALSIGAGLLAGLAMETKYTAFLAPAVMLLYAGLFWRIHLGLAAAATAGLFFYSFEVFLAVMHGESHFICNLKQQGSTLSDKLGLGWPFLTIIGGLSPPVTLLGLTALGVRGRTVAIVAGLMALGYLLMTVCEGVLHLNVSADFMDGVHSDVPLEYVIFRMFGVVSLGVTAAGMWRLFRPILIDAPAECGSAAGELVAADDLEGAGTVLELTPRRSWFSPFVRIDIFLVLWLLGEVLGHFLLTPFPAVRRLMGVMVVGTLLAGRLAARTSGEPARRRMVDFVALGGILLGFCFYAVDMFDAFASRSAAEDAAQLIRQHDPNARIWYVGHWGFQYYAENAGMQPVKPNITALDAGDWLVKPEWRLNQQMIDFPSSHLKQVDVVTIADGPPLRTIQCFYGGYSPLEHHEGHRAQVTVYRVTWPFVARPLW